MTVRAASLAVLLLAGCPAHPPHARPATPHGPRPAVREAVTAPADRRLPGDVRPEHYALEMTIDPRAPRFSGEVTIDVTLARATRHVLLHAEGLQVSRAELTVGRAVVPARWVVVDADEGLAALAVDEPVGPGRAVLRLRWDAPFDEQLDGLYRVQEAGGPYAATQFEAIWARRAFPCFDEPRFKTPFDVTLRVPRGLVAVGNTRVVEEHDAAGGQHVLRLATTAPLPTYLLAWLVGPFEVVEAPPIPAGAVARPPLPLRGLAAAGRGPELAFALREAAELVAALEATTGIAYPFDKLDLAALSSFDAGAMENAGLVIFQEELLLVDEQTAGQAARADVSATIAHELAHQWFGNLVTAAWWDDIWLNESLATWAEMRLTAQRHAAWGTGLDTLDSIHGIMDKDGLASARRLREPITTNDDIADAFDWITYLKGASVLGMLEHWLGPDVLLAGLRAYLGAHRDGSARSDDLVSALSSAAGRDVGPTSHAFLDQPGVPTIAVEPSCTARQGVVVLRQSPWVPIGGTSPADRSWQVPVCLRYDGGPGPTTAAPEHCVLLTAREQRVELPAAARCPRWVMPNADAAGYYRWSLAPAAERALLSRGIAHLSDRERVSVADALVAAVWSGHTPIEVALAAVPTLARDPQPAVLRALTPLVALVHDRLADEALLPRVLPWIRGLSPGGFPRTRLAPVPGQPPPSAAEVARVEMLASLGEDAVLRRALADRVARWLDGDATVLAPELVELGLGVAAADGDAALFDRIRSRLLQSSDALVRARLLQALGSFTDPALAARARALELDDALPVDEMGEVLSTQLQADETRPAAWAWMKGHWEALVARLGPDLAAFWIEHANGFCTAEDARDVRAFFGPRAATLPGAPRLLDNAVETIELCAARVAATRDGARRFFGR